MNDYTDTLVPPANIPEAKPAPAPEVTAPAPAPVKPSGGLAASMREVSQARGEIGTPSSWELIGKKVLPDAVPTSADFWVPLISAVGGYLGAGSPTVGGAVGKGLTAGAAAWMAQQKQAEDIKNQIATRGQEQEKIGLAGRELGLKESQIQRQLEAAQNVAKILGGGDITPPKIIAQQSTVGLKPPARPTAAGLHPQDDYGPVGATGLAPAGTPTGGLAPAGVQDAQEMSSAAQNFWDNVDPESNPNFLFNRAAQLDRAAVAAAMDPTQQAKYLELANATRQRAVAIRDKGQVSLKNGDVVVIPGFAKAQADIAAAKSGAEAEAQARIQLQTQPDIVRAKRIAEEEVKLRFTPAVGPGGEEIINPNAPPPGAVPTDAQIPPAPPPANRPEKASFDDNNHLITAIPSAPPGGGYEVVKTDPGGKIVKQTALNKNYAAEDAKFIEDVIVKGSKIDDALQRFYSMQNGFKLFESGSKEESLAGWAALAQSFGMPDLAQRLAGGDASAVQIVQKNVPAEVLSALGAVNSRFAQSEFTTMTTKGSANPSSLPDANFSIVTDGIAPLERQKAFLRDWAQAKKEGWQSPSAFFQVWSEANPLSQFQIAARRKAGNFKGMDIPSASDWVPGAIYVVPKNISDQKQKSELAKMNLNPGDLFKFNGRNAPITKIPANKKFSAYMEQ
jgi:hypothetical protein